MSIRPCCVFLAGGIGLALGCASSPPPPSLPAQVQVNFNLAPETQGARHVTRGAISGLPQHVGFYYSVNPDCSSDGLVQLQIKSAPAHGSVNFVGADQFSVQGVGPHGKYLETDYAVNVMAR